MNWRQRTTCTTYGNSRPVHGAVDPEKPNRTKGQYRVLNHFEPLWSIMIHYESHLSSISNPQVDCFLWGCGPQRQENLEELSRRSGWVSKSIRSTYRELLKSSLFVLFSRNQLRNSVLQKSSLFGFPQAECRICDDVLFLTHYFANVAFRLVFAWKHSGVLLLKCCVACIIYIYIWHYYSIGSLLIVRPQNA